MLLIKYIKFESFHKNLSNYPNVFSIKYNCFNSIKWLVSKKINIDLIYIDFCKKDRLLIKLVDTIFYYYPHIIIIGDDAVFLNESLRYFKKKYNFVLLRTCYICTFKKKIANTKELLKKSNNEYYKSNLMNFSKIKHLEEKYKINYIKNLITSSCDVNNIIEKIKILGINPNTKCIFLNQNSNIFHFLIYSRSENESYYLKLYNKLNEIFKDENVKNNFNLIPKDYLEFTTNFF